MPNSRRNFIKWGATTAGAGLAMSGGTAAAEAASKPGGYGAPPQPLVPPIGPGDMTWDTIGEWRTLLTGPGTLIANCVHPLVGAGIDQYSTFRTDPWGRAYRRWDSVVRWFYDGAYAQQEGERLVRLHRDFNGTDQKGQHFDALDPETRMWVPMSGFETYLLGRRIFATGHTPAEEPRVYDEFRRMMIGSLLIPENVVPKDYDAYRRYWDNMVRHGMVNHPVCHELLEVMSDVGFPGPLPPVLAQSWFAKLVSREATRRVIVGTIPPEIRSVLGLQWTPFDEAELKALGRMIAASHVGMSDQMRYYPFAYRARESAKKAQPPGR